MPLRLIPLADKIAVAWLAAHSEVTAIFGTRIATALDPNPTFPFLTVTLYAGAEKSQRNLDEQYLQLDSWGLTRAGAAAGIAIARAALIEAPSGSHTGAVVSHVRTVSTPRWMPDDTVTPPRPRYMCELAVSIHP